MIDLFLLCAVVQEGQLPLHWAAINGTELEVVAALLDEHPDAAEVADEVLGGGSLGEKGLWMCVYVGGSV